MPATLSNPRDAYLTLLAELLFVERTLSSEVIPQTLGKVTSTALSGVLASHLEQTRRHATNVEQSFRIAGAETSSSHSGPFVALKEEHATLAESAATPAMADLVHAQAALHIEHFEIASYRALIAAAQAPAPDAIPLLKENLDSEEQAADDLQELLAQLAESVAGLSAGASK
jgi:ferritin-like metal-binding protein YciE